MIGKELSRYRIVEQIGVGGMGEVYRGVDPSLEREVAVKVLPEQFAKNSEAVERFQRENKVLAALSHPNIRPIYDIGEAQGRIFAVMELLEGETLATRLERSALDWRKAKQIALAVADGLAAAHGKGIIHRDVKPQNIFLTATGEVKLIDFGLARVEIEGSEDLTAASTLGTQQGAILGTVQYMSPEQVGGKPADARSDIFGFGCVLYEMLTGKRPFSRETAAETMVAILKDQPPGLAASGAGAPGGELRRIVTHCLEKRPEDRFQSAGDLAFALTLVGCGAYADEGATPQVAESLPVQAREDPEASVAVLPFVNLSSDQEIESFRDGLAEELIGALSKIAGLRVAAQTPTSFESDSRDIRKIGEQLNVRMVLQGSLRRAGNRLRINAQLVNVVGGYHLWGETFDREMDDVFAVQDEIARSIALLIEACQSDLRSVGLLKSIAYRRRDAEPMREVKEAVVRVGRGLDRENRPGGKREVTLLSAEAWEETCRELETELPWYTRRANLLVERIDLAETITHTIRVGEVEIRVHGETKPCDIMDEQHEGLRRTLIPDCRGGVYGQVLEGGTIRVGDRVSVVTDAGPLGLRRT